MERTRTFSWSDPMDTAARVGKESGLDLCRAIVEGRAPQAPFCHAIEFFIVEASEGRTVFECKPQEYHYNPAGTVHGGLAATLLDSAMGAAVYTTLPAGFGYTTTQLNVNLVRAITKDTPKLRAEGRVLHKGKSTITAEGTLKDESGRLYAHGTTTCLVMDVR